MVLASGPQGCKACDPSTQLPSTLRQAQDRQGRPSPTAYGSERGVLAKGVYAERSRSIEAGPPGRSPTERNEAGRTMSAVGVDSW